MSGAGRPAVAIARPTGWLARPRIVLGLAGVYASSRALGLVREIGIAFFFGTSVAADRLSAAFVVASLVSIIGGEAFYAGSVRWLGEARPDPPAAFSEARYANLVAVARSAALASTAAFLLVGPLATLVVLGNGEGSTQAVALAAALAPSVGAALVSACINARLTLERRFVLMNGAQALYSVGALIGLAFIGLFGRGIGPLPVALGWSAGNVAAAVTLYARARPRPRRRDSEARAFALLRIGLPIAMAYSLVAIQSLTDRTVAARIGPGRVAALSYADRLFLLPVGFVIAALGPIVLGALVAERQQDRSVELAAFHQLRTVVSFLVPLSLLFVACAPWLVSFVFESGHFNAQSRDLTVAALDGFSVGIAAVAVSLVLFRMMQAVSKLREIVIVSVFAVVLNAVSTVGGALWLGLYGVTLSTSLVAVALVVLQTVRLSVELGRRWATEALKCAVVPVAVCCAVSIVIVTANHRGALGDPPRAVVLVAAAAIAAALGSRRKQQPE